MPVTITSQGPLGLYRDGVLLSSHTLEAQALEAAIAHAENYGNGDYELRSPNKVIRVSLLTKVVVPFSWEPVAVEFVQGTASTINLALYVSNPESYPLVCAANSALPAGVTLVGNELRYSGAGSVTSSSLSFTAVSGQFVAVSGTATVRIVAAPPTPEPTPITVQVGEYWGIPSAYPQTKSPYGGTYQIWQTLPRKLDGTLGEAVDYYRVGGNWKDIETADGVYDWNQIDDRSTSGATGLKQIAAAGKKAVVWVVFSEFKDGSTNAETPAWLVSKCNLQTVADSGDGAGLWGYALWQNSSTVPANPTNPRQYWLRFIRKFGERYGTNGTSPYKDLIAGIYIGTFNAGGELWLPTEVRSVTNSTGVGGGLTESAGGVLENYVQEILDEWLKYFTPAQCIWEGWDDTAWCAGARNATAYAINTKGCSARAGNGEFVWNSSTSPSTISTVFKRSITPAAYVDAPAEYYRTVAAKENVGPNGLAIFADEFENSSNLAAPTVSTVSGTVLSDMYRSYRQAVLYGLHRSVSWWMFPDEIQRREELAWSNLAQFRALADHCRKVAGYPRGKSPIAFVELQRWNDGVYSARRRFDNVERFMIQRDTPADGKTVPTETATTLWPYPTWTTGASFSEARRTNIAGGSNRIYFQMETGFASTTESAFEICVYYKDTGNVSWCLQYSSPTVSPVSTQEVTNGNTGAWKTARFALTNVRFRRALSSSMDFCIWNKGTTDLTVKNVRVLRTVPV
jgi:hypothetical protein